MPLTSDISPLVCCRTATAGSLAALSQVITPEVEGQCPSGHLWPLVFDLTADKGSRHSAVRQHFVIGEQNRECLISSFCGGARAVGTGTVLRAGWVRIRASIPGKDKNVECSPTARNCTGDPQVPVQLILGAVSGGTGAGA